MSAIDYQLEKIKGIAFDIDGVLSPALVPLGPDGIPQRMANLKDGYALVQAVRRGLKIAIISGGTQTSVANRFKIIGVEDIYLCTDDKLPVLKEWMERHGLLPEEVAYVGDDVPDLAPMSYVGLPVTPADGSNDTLMAARYVTSAIGGHGVARELIEQVLRAQNNWPTAL